MRPNFDQYASDLEKDRNYDPGSQFSMPWQSGVTGIGWNPDLTGGHPVTSLEQPTCRARSACSAATSTCSTS